ncbi:MAG: sugar ABC transporter substrate-binding protein [Gallionella sp.]|jgi:ABC-type sugar transport system substrate-binding protein
MKQIGLTILIISLALFLATGIFRGPIRIIIAKLSTFSFLFAMSVLGLSITDSIGENFKDIISSASNWLGVISAAITFFLGYGSKFIMRITGRPLIAIVIPSRSVFFSDVRRGLHESLVTISHELYDEFNTSLSPGEDLPSFTRYLRHTLEKRPDFVIIAAPTTIALSDHEVATLIDNHLQRGGMLFTIENRLLSPKNECYARRLISVQSDSTSGAALLAKFANRIVTQDSTVVIIAGPADSHPAKVRKELFAKELPMARIHVIDVANWSPAAARRLASNSLAEIKKIDLIVCGNDEMALSVSRLVQELKLPHSPVVLGYDGISRALYAIAELSNPLIATIRIPPSEYGEKIGTRIKLLCKLGGVFINSDLPPIIEIPISESNLVTQDNVENLL